MNSGTIFIYVFPNIYDYILLVFPREGVLQNIKKERKSVGRFVCSLSN